MIEINSNISVGTININELNSLKKGSSQDGDIGRYSLPPCATTQGITTRTQNN